MILTLVTTINWRVAKKILLGKYVSCRWFFLFFELPVSWVLSFISCGKKYTTRYDWENLSKTGKEKISDHLILATPKLRIVIRVTSGIGWRDLGNAAWSVISRATASGGEQDSQRFRDHVVLKASAQQSAYQDRIPPQVLGNLTYTSAQFVQTLLICIHNWCCFYHFVRNSLLALLEAVCARIGVHNDFPR